MLSHGPVPAQVVHHATVHQFVHVRSERQLGSQQQACSSLPPPIFWHSIDACALHSGVLM